MSLKAVSNLDSSPLENKLADTFFLHKCTDCRIKHLLHLENVVSVVLYWYTITNTKSILVMGHDIWYTITKTSTKSIKIL